MISFWTAYKGYNGLPATPCNRPTPLESGRVNWDSHQVEEVLANTNEFHEDVDKDANRPIDQYPDLIQGQYKSVDCSCRNLDNIHYRLLPLKQKW